MRRMIVVSLFVLAACSSHRANSTSKPIKPDIQIVQTSTVPAAARYAGGGLNIAYTARVTNRSSENLKLKRITVESLSEGAYNVQPHSVPFDVEISPNQYQEVSFWAPAQTGASIVGANGPVMLRVTCVLESPSGKFQHMVTRVVNERTAVSGEQ